MELWRNNQRMMLCLFTGISFILSCNKKDFLDQKPSSDLVVPSTLDDFQKLLDNNIVMQETPVLGELSTDDFYLSDSSWQTLSTKERNAYVWAPDIYEGQGKVDDWNMPYQQVFYANVVLEGLSGVPVDSSNAGRWNGIQGSAYFIRAYAFYNLAQVFAGVYDSGTLSDPGIPLRLSSSINQVSVRATLGDTYTQILSDLHKAISLLSDSIPRNNLNRPSKPAAYAMLARVYLSMRDYANARLYADSCLQLYATLIDYNTVPRNIPFYFQNNNAETIYQSNLLSTSGAIGAFIYPCIIDSNLYRSYADSDLRKYVFFYTTLSGSILFNIGYSGTVYPFSGLATDEVYLIRAECSARLNDPVAALDDLDNLMQNRWASGSFTNYPVTTAVAALDTILVERRKELILRGLRWTDLRRLNAEGKNITLTRMLDSASYQLLPNDQRYILPIPPDVISLSGIAQNPR